MNKNDIVTVEITDIGVSGEGIGHVDGYTLFIKDGILTPYYGVSIKCIT